MTHLFRRPITLGHALVVLVLAAAIGGGTFALASIPGPDGQIKGCVRKKAPNKGALRVIDSTKRCAGTERTLSWNQRGPAGAQGLQGLQGPEGQAGQTGQTGQQGVPGPTASGFSKATANLGIAKSPGTTVSQLSDADGTGKLTVSFPARILATGTVTMFKQASDAAVSAQTACQIEMATDPSTTFKAISGSHEVELQESNWDGKADNAVFEVLPVTGAIDVDPGTYDFRILCTNTGGSFDTASSTAKGRQLSVLATAR